MFSRLSDHLWPAFEQLEKAQIAATGTPGIPTGFEDLDAITGGWQSGDLVIISGATGMGKSALAYHFALIAATSATTGTNQQHELAPIAGRITAFVSLEYPPDRLVVRMISTIAGVETNRVIRGTLDEHNYGRLAVAAGTLNKAPLYVLYAPRLTVEDMVKDLSELQKTHGLDLVVVDTLNLLHVGKLASPPANREQEVGTIVRELKAAALELNIPLLATASLSRSVDQRFGKRPQLPDLRDSGDIENTADIVLFVYRPEYYYGPTDKEGNSLERAAELIVAKSRSTSETYVPVWFYKESGSFNQPESR